MHMRLKSTFLRKALFVAGILLALDAVLVIGVGMSSPALHKADAAIVLGAAIYSPALHNRTTTALNLYNSGLVGELVLSGGKIARPDISEAESMRRVIVHSSPSMPPVLLDDQSSNTYENIKNSKALLGGNKKIIIVSDRYHLARAVLLAKRAGFTDVQWTGPGLDYYRPIEVGYYYVREIVAMISYIPKFIFG